MSAYNWLEFESLCPFCKKKTTIRAQMHTAASFSGDLTGRFCHRTFHIGDQMSWFNKDDKRYKIEWQLEHSSSLPEDNIIEACYSECLNCKASLYSLVLCSNLTITGVQQVGLEKDWPQDYTK